MIVELFIRADVDATVTNPRPLFKNDAFRGVGKEDDGWETVTPLNTYFASSTLSSHR